jgi:hypothetical protein
MLLTIRCVVCRFVPVALKLIGLKAVLELVRRLRGVNLLMLVKLQRLPVERLLGVVQLVLLLLMISILLLGWLLFLLRTHRLLSWV